MAFQTRPDLATLQQQGLLIGVNGETFRNSAEMQHVLNHYPAGDEVELSLRARSGHVTTQPATLRYFTQLRAAVFPRPLWLALIFLGAGAWGVWKRLDDPVTRSFALFSAFGRVCSRRLVRCVEHASFCSPVAAGGRYRRWSADPFCRSSPSQFQRPHPRTLLAGFPDRGYSLPVSAILAADEPNPFLLTELWIRLFGFGIFSLIAFLGALIYRRFFSPSPIDVEQTQFIWGPRDLPTLISLLAEQSGLMIQIPLIIVLPLLAVFAMTTAYTVVRYRVINTSFLVSRALVYALLTILAGGGYAGLISGFSFLFNSSVGMTNPIVVGGLIFILALLVNPFRAAVQRMLDTVFVRGEEVFQDYLAEFEGQLSQQVELTEISRLLREFVAQHLEPTRMHIYVHDVLVDRYVPMAGEDGRPTTDIRFPRNSGLVHLLIHRSATLYLNAEESCRRNCGMNAPGWHCWAPSCSSPCLGRIV